MWRDDGKELFFVGDDRTDPTMGVAEQLVHQQEQVLRVYPPEWFY